MLDNIRDIAATYQEIRGRAAHTALMAGVSVAALDAAMWIRCPDCGEHNVFAEMPCWNCGEALPMRKAA